MTSSSSARTTPPGFDTHAAVTRSLLGWGVVAGPVYLVVGLALGLTRPEFDLTRHSLSLLMLGEHGWMQRANLLLSAAMVLAAAYGMLRTIRNGRGLAMATLIFVYAAGMILSAAFPPDPVEGFPADSAGRSVSTSGVLHMLFGAVGFVALAGAAFVYARWCHSRGESHRSVFAAGCGTVILLGFLGGAMLALSAVGVALLWLGVLSGWVWLAVAAGHLYIVVPHPVLSQRTGGAT
ncbi:MAG: DUF998 domain-containing protein [Dermatophilaceae bacterium]